MLVRCLYASLAASSNASAISDAILAQSRKNNPPRGITGMLCFTNEFFIQILEGGRAEVCELFNTITRDDRHSRIQILVFEEISERKFGNWSMAQVNISKINPALLLKYSETATLNPFSSSGHAISALLDELIATAAIVGRGNTIIEK
jgi:hypothetical protein